MEWPLEQICKDEDVFILGGGPSFKKFPLSFLEDKKVIGCNDAYLFGPSIVDFVIFGDLKWWNNYKSREDFISFPNPIFSNCRELKKEKRVIWCPREREGFHKNAIGWNGNTGSAAINLALILGASRIFLIGFDMYIEGKGRTNWHLCNIAVPTQEVYDTYIEKMERTKGMIEKNWPSVEIINLNPESRLTIFPKKTLEEIYKGKDN